MTYSDLTGIRDEQSLSVLPVSAGSTFQSAIYNNKADKWWKNGSLISVN